MIFLKSFKALGLFSRVILSGLLVSISVGWDGNLAWADSDSSMQGWAPSAPKSADEKPAPTELKNEKVETETDAAKVLKSVESKYAKATAVEMSLNKVTENKLLKKKKTASGKISLKNHGLFRMDLDAPDKSSVILDGKKLWVVQYPTDPDFDNTVHVIVSKNPKKIQTPVLTTFLMGKGSLLDDFNVSKKSSAEGILEIELSPKKPSADVKSLILKLDQAKKEIVQITMKDNVDNATEYNFENIKFNGDVPDKNFEFKAPKGAEVNEM